MHFNLISLIQKEKMIDSFWTKFQNSEYSEATAFRGDGGIQRRQRIVGRLEEWQQLHCKEFLGFWSYKFRFILKRNVFGVKSKSFILAMKLQTSFCSKILSLELKKAGAFGIFFGAIYVCTLICFEFSCELLKRVVTI